MIVLDFSLSSEPELEHYIGERFSDDHIDMSLLYGRVTFLVDDVDLAWPGALPVLDVAREIYWAVGRLSCQEPVQKAELLDYYDTLRLCLINDGWVELYSEATKGRAVCRVKELREAAVVFGVKALRACYERYPESASSEALRKYYPFRVDMADQ